MRRSGLVRVQRKARGPSERASRAKRGQDGRTRWSGIIARAVATRGVQLQRIPARGPSATNSTRQRRDFETTAPEEAGRAERNARANRQTET
eukprot:2877074-Alexandrium_andersonii.AAC.1